MSSTTTYYYKNLLPFFNTRKKGFRVGQGKGTNIWQASREYASLTVLSVYVADVLDRVGPRPLDSVTKACPFQNVPSEAVPGSTSLC